MSGDADDSSRTDADTGTDGDGDQRAPTENGRDTPADTDDGRDGASRDGDGSDGEVVTYDERETPLARIADRVDSDGLPVVGDEESSDSESAGESASVDPNGDDGRTGPLGELASGLGERSDRSTAFDELFERQTVAGIDGDALWERIERENVEDGFLAEREIREIEKRAYCHQCEYFSTPPAVACENEGTEILELASLDAFRVADCPFVLEDEELEDDART